MGYGGLQQDFPRVCSTIGVFSCFPSSHPVGLLLGPPVCTSVMQDSVTRCHPPWRWLRVGYITWGVKGQPAPTLSGSISRLP